MKLGIANKIILSIEITVLVILIFAGVSSYFIFGRVFEQQAYKQLESVSVLKTNTIKGFFDEIISEIEFFNNRRTVHPFLLRLLESNKMEDRNVIETRIADLLTYKKMFSEIMILDKNGIVIFTSVESDEGKIRANEPYFLNAKSSTFLQNFYYDASLGKPVMAISTPITDDKGIFLGELVGRINVERINTLMVERSGLGTTGESFLVNGSNLAVTDLLKESGSALKKTIYLPQIESCLEGKSAAFSLPDYHGDLVFGYYKWFPEMGSCLITKIDKSEATAELSGDLLVMLLILLSGGLVMGLYGFFQAKTIIDPIRKLHRAVMKIKSGDFEVQSNIKSNDEIGEMAASFDDMAQKLKASYADLELKVAEKTKELAEKISDLEKINKLMVGTELTMMDLKKKLSEKQE